MSDYIYETVESDLVVEGVRKITLNRPDSLNAMNRQLIDDVMEALLDAQEDPATKVIILSGKGRAFCAGDDRHEHVHPESEEEARDLVEAIQKVTEVMLFGDKPIVGAINGWAVGGGFEWAINCDFPVWGKTARAFFPEVSLNLFVTGAVTSLLPALVGVMKAKEMLMFGEQYSANDLFDMGVAWRVVDDEQLLSEAIYVARRLAEQPEKSLRAMKRVLNKTAMTSIREALRLETDATVAGFMDPETTKLLKDFD